MKRTLDISGPPSQPGPLTTMAEPDYATTAKDYNVMDELRARIAAAATHGVPVAQAATLPLPVLLSILGNPSYAEGQDTHQPQYSGEPNTDVASTADVNQSIANLRNGMRNSANVAGQSLRRGGVVLGPLSLSKRR